MKKSFLNDKLIETVATIEWSKTDAGCSSKIDYNNQCAVFAKEQPIANLLQGYANKVLKNVDLSTKKSSPSKTLMERLEVSGVGGVLSTTTSSFVDDCLSLSDNFTSFYSLQSDFIKSMRSPDRKLVISCDISWSGNCNLISYNFCLFYFDKIYYFIFFPFLDVKLSLNYMLGSILDTLCLNQRVDRRKFMYKFIPRLNPSGKIVYEYASSYNDALSKAKYAFDLNDNGTKHLLSDVCDSHCFKSVVPCCDSSTISSIPIVLLIEHGLRFLSYCDTSSQYSLNILNYDRYYYERENAFCTSKPIPYRINSIHDSGWRYVYPIQIEIRDFSVLDFIKGSSDDIGRACGFDITDYTKTSLGSDFILNLDKFLEYHPDLYFDFVSSIITYRLAFSSLIFGFNRHIPHTIPSAACDVAKSIISSDLDCSSLPEYYAKYVGVKRVRSKLLKDSSFKRTTSFFPLCPYNEKVLNFASLAYRGGYNSCFCVSKDFDHETYDLDICSAYPTSLYLVPAIDWDKPIKSEIINRDLTLSDFLDENGNPWPMIPLFAYCKYSFPEDFKYPNLKNDGSLLEDEDAPCYPLKEDSFVYCSGPELYLALLHGAKIFVREGFICNCLKDSEGNIVFPYRHLVKSLVKARSDASEAFGSKSLEPRVLKFIVNSLYGKTAQNVSRTNSKSNDESVLTNPVSACLATAFVRSVLFCAFKLIDQSFFKIISSTTDGLITDMPFERFKALDFGRFGDLLIESRQGITGYSNPSTWEVKHKQTDLLNLTTRGNVSLLTTDDNGLGGVIAKASLSSAYRYLPKEALPNRLAFYNAAVTRTGGLPNLEITYTELKDVRKGCPFRANETTNNISLDFDMKRKPVESSLRAVSINIDGVDYEFACVETIPYADSFEFEAYRTVAKSMRCLRTVDEWKLFFARVKAYMSGFKKVPKSNEDIEFKSLCNVIAGYKAKLWKIPYLDNPKLKVSDKVKWINSFNTSPTHEFKKKTWERMGEKKHQENLLPLEILKPMLDKMGAILPE